MNSVSNNVIIGLGNTLMSDEGIGVLLLNELSKNKNYHKDTLFLDMGTSCFRCLHVIAGKKKAVFIDCAFMDKDPGTIVRFTPEDVKSEKVIYNQSLHEGDLLNTIELSKSLNECPDDIVIFGIQPEYIGEGTEISPSLKDNFHNFINTIKKEIK
ncbi:MAG: hydrogenase maturation protease [Candidatus Theseobacter exili]|nr:hydrogenase maturation protease [Candidatus Theseobacter exili]